MRLCRMYPAAARKESAHPDTAGRCLLQNIAKKDRQARRQKYKHRPEYPIDIPGGFFSYSSSVQLIKLLHDLLHLRESSRLN